MWIPCSYHWYIYFPSWGPRRASKDIYIYDYWAGLGWAGVILDFAVLNCNQLPPSSALKLTKLPLIKFLPHSIVDYIEKFKEASLLIQDFQFDKKKLHIWSK